MEKEPKRYYVWTCLASCLIVWLTLPSKAQDTDVIYLVDETLVKGNLVEISTKKIKYTNDSKQVRSYDAEEVIMLVNRAGNYIVFPLQAAGTMPDEFMKATSKPPIDYLITLEKKVIPAYIMAMSENEVMYEDAGQPKGERSIGKEMIAAIIYTSGKHELLVSPSQASEILAGVQSQIKTFNSQSFVRKTADTQPKADTVNTANVETATPTTQTTTPKAEPASSTEAAPPVVNPANPIAQDKPVNAAQASASNKKETANSAAVEAKNEVKSEPAKAETKPAEKVNIEISEEEFKRLRGVALRKVTDLTEYIKIISDVNTDREKAKTTIDMACALFADEDARIEVSNIKTGAKNKYKIRDYLTRLSYKTSKYDKIDIDYANINYAKEFKQREDGNYYGEIEFMQTFKGFSNNKVIYGDITKRKAIVIQKLYDKYKDGTSQKLWDVFLSDIGVVETQKF